MKMVRYASQIQTGLMRQKKNGDYLMERTLKSSITSRRYSHFLMANERFTQRIIKEENILMEQLNLHTKTEALRRGIQMAGYGLRTGKEISSVTRWQIDSNYFLFPCAIIELTKFYTILKNVYLILPIELEVFLFVVPLSKLINTGD